MRQTLSALLVTVLAGAAAAPALGQTEALYRESARYQACIGLAESDPDSALDEAQTWLIEGGGWPAEVCEARALIALGESGAGASALAAIANRAPVGMVAAERVELLTLAGETWSGLGAGEDARNAFDDALTLDPRAAAPLAGRAALSLQEEEWAALSRDANQLIAIAPERADGWYYRGEYRLQEDDYDGAWDDMSTARSHAPQRIDILLLRGKINEARRLAAAAD